ncbi:hypothetical protein [Agreia sp.]|uniref:hypothetical protein n=1 Tax=Agreia sp. TaxID=1872416 RepID=UPI0035BC33ED
MTADKNTQDAPIMDGANEASEEEKEAGRQDHARADMARDGGLDDDLRSIRAVDEGKTRPRTEGNGNGSDGAVDISGNSDTSNNSGE